MRDADNFDFFSDRLHFIDVANDPRLNMELWHRLSAFESHVYGIVMQYQRIRSDLGSAQPDDVRTTCGAQVGLDIYYYVLTWDKLGKVFAKLKATINRIQQSNPGIPNAFGLEFRTLRTRLDHVLSEFRTAVRNEYEHPSLNPYSVGNLVTWGSLMIDASGDIAAHVGANVFATVKMVHCTRIQQLRVELIDLFVRHFSKRQQTAELIKVRTHVEESVDSWVEELTRLHERGDEAGFSDLLHKFFMYDLYLGKEGVPLSAYTRNRVHSVLIEMASVSTRPVVPPDDHERDGQR